MSGTYDGSASDATTQGLRNQVTFQNGGGLRIPEWFWPVALAALIAGGVAVFWIWKRK